MTPQSETPLLRVEGPHTCNRTLNDPKDVHWSVFDEQCGNVAHFWKKEDADEYATMKRELSEKSRECEVKATALKDTLGLLESTTAERDALKKQVELLENDLRGAMTALRYRQPEINASIEKIRALSQPSNPTP
jgi:predicted  nucleic acid-binding Zn-ribbon protein